uniref:Uncharacterized protein n=1 Tax=Micrurus corallinus TaxID=54390 RepID=A0A2D4GCY0_MICCO
MWRLQLPEFPSQPGGGNSGSWKSMLLKRCLRMRGKNPTLNRKNMGLANLQKTGDFLQQGAERKLKINLERISFRQDRRRKRKAKYFWGEGGGWEAHEQEGKGPRAPSGLGKSEKSQAEIHKRLDPP